MLCLFGVLTQIVINYSFTSLCIFVSANCLFLIICFLKCTLSIVSKCVLSILGQCIITILGKALSLFLVNVSSMFYLFFV